MFAGQCFRACGRIHFGVANQTSSLKTFADGTNYSFRRQISESVVMAKIYLNVTFNAVVRPVLTVAVVLTLAKPGADTVIV
jgi:hypothetical protein